MSLARPNLPPTAPTGPPGKGSCSCFPASRSPPHPDSRLQMRPLSSIARRAWRPASRPQRTLDGSAPLCQRRLPHVQGGVHRGASVLRIKVRQSPPHRGQGHRDGRDLGGAVGEVLEACLVFSPGPGTGFPNPWGLRGCRGQSGTFCCPQAPLDTSPPSPGGGLQTDLIASSRALTHGASGQSPGKPHETKIRERLGRRMHLGASGGARWRDREPPARPRTSPRWLSLAMCPPCPHDHRPRPATNPESRPSWRYGRCCPDPRPVRRAAQARAVGAWGAPHCHPTRASPWRVPKCQHEPHRFTVPPTAASALHRARLPRQGSPDSARDRHAA